MGKVSVIAEIGSVHDGSFGNAVNLIEMVSQCGADGVKFQTHIAEAETLPDAPMPSFFQGEARFDYFNRTAFSKEQWGLLKSKCHERGLSFISSPFSVEAVALLEEIGVDSYKIPSGEVTNVILLHEVGKTGKDIILSSGMSSWKELDGAVEILKKYDGKLTVLQCTSAYPCPYEKVGLNIMEEMGRRYSLPTGLSDHTLTNYASLAAVAKGAIMIERHVTFSRLMYGSDAKHSLEPDELKDLITGIRAIEVINCSTVDKDDMASSLSDMKKVFEKSIVSLVDIPEGEKIVEKMLGVKKPGTGIPPSRLNEIIGCRSTRFIPKDSLLSEKDFF